VTITVLWGPSLCGVALLDAPGAVKPEITKITNSNATGWIQADDNDDNDHNDNQVAAFCRRRFNCIMGMKLNCFHIFIVMVAFCTDVSLGRPLSVSSCTVVFIIYLGILIISCLTTFLGTYNLSVLMCRTAVNECQSFFIHSRSPAISCIIQSMQESNYIYVLFLVHHPQPSEHNLLNPSWSDGHFHYIVLFLYSCTHI